MAVMDSTAPEAAPAPAGVPGAHPLISGMSALHDLSRAKFDKLSDAKAMLEKVKSELLPLAKMGETVSQEDVIKAAGKMVGHGLGASAVAGLLADMPQDGQPLAAWVAQHMIGVQQREAQLQPVLAKAQHELGVHAIQLLAAHRMHGPAPSGPPGSAGQNNPLVQPEAPAAGGSRSEERRVGKEC
jgi:hypothetical protein